MIEDDVELLRLYAEEKSEAAFAALVQRRVDFVYACALRRVGGDCHSAEDVTQQVFTALARNASALARRRGLSGWLFVAARNASAETVRGERRRKKREAEAHVMNEITLESAGDAEWQRLRPVIDGAMDELQEEDREAVLLRFFEGKSFGEVGASLRLTENTARMRVTRALETLQGLLARRGITSTTAALGMALANQATVAAPAGFSASVAGTAMAGAAAGGLGAVGIVTFMSTSKIGLGVAVVCACVCVGVALFEAKELRAARAEVATSGQRQDDLNAKLRELEGKLAAQTKRATEAEDDLAKLLAAGQKVHVAQAAAAEAASAAPITKEVVDARYKRGQELARNGQWEEALKEFLWCFDQGMPRVQGYAGVRTSFLLSEIEKIRPAGIAALRARRDEAEKRLRANSKDGNGTEVQDFVAINRVLGENSATLAIFDQPLDSDVRRKMTIFASQQLIDSQRYADVLKGQPYERMSATFDTMTKERELPANIQDPQALRSAMKESLITSTARNIEVLAGAGEVANARTLAERLLAYDSSPKTRALIEQHATRAGQPKLLSP